MGTASPDQTADLWLKIDQLHLNFLKSEDNSKKIDIRKRLHGYIHQYMCLVPQDRKFCYPLTSEIIWRSARWVPNFSALKAASAFEAIEKYAANLINQPWRKEFKEIRQYGGFYKHQVECSLSGAEKLFQLMGYSPTGQETMILSGSVDQDCATTVARDCVLAYVECQIVVSIMQGVSAQFPCSWEEVLDFRRDHIGSPEQAIRALVYLKNQLQYQLQQQPHLPMFNNFQARGDAPGYQHQNGLESIGTVPTGNLVEVDDRQRSDLSQGQWGAPIPLTIKQYEEDQRRKSELPKPDQAMDSWDYVYQELENIGYTKDQAERPDVLELLLSRVAQARERSRIQPDQSQPQVPVREKRAMPPPLETLNHPPPLVKERSNRHRRPLQPPPIVSPITPPIENPPVMENPPALPQKKRPLLKPIVTTEVREVRYSNDYDEEQEEWECFACTYINTDPNAEICEMCAKSRNLKSPDMSGQSHASSRKNPSSGTDLEYCDASNGLESPEPNGDHQAAADSVQCAKCTLVNDARLRACEACGASLHIAPLELTRPSRKSRNKH